MKKSRTCPEWISPSLPPSLPPPLPLSLPPLPPTHHSVPLSHPSRPPPPLPPLAPIPPSHPFLPSVRPSVRPSPINSRRCRFGERTPCMHAVDKPTYLHACPSKPQRQEPGRRGHDGRDADPEAFRDVRLRDALLRHRVERDQARLRQEHRRRQRERKQKRRQLDVVPYSCMLYRGVNHRLGRKPFSRRERRRRGGGGN